MGLIPLIILTISTAKLQTVKFNVNFDDPHCLLQQLTIYRLNACIYPPVNNLTTPKTDEYTMQESIMNDLKCNYRNKKPKPDRNNDSKTDDEQKIYNDNEKKKSAVDTTA